MCITCSLLIHYLLNTYSQLVYTLFVTCSWVVNVLFITCSLLFHYSFTTWSDFVCDLFMSCSWVVNDLFTTCLCLAHNLFLHNLFKLCLWLVHELFITCSLFYSLLIHIFFTLCLWLFHELLITCPGLVHDMTSWQYLEFLYCTYFKTFFSNFGKWGILHSIGSNHINFTPFCKRSL